jgi:hypothetical protein
MKKDRGEVSSPSAEALAAGGVREGACPGRLF